LSKILFPAPEIAHGILILIKKTPITLNELIKKHGLQNKVQTSQINPTHLTVFLFPTAYDENCRSAIAAGRRKPPPKKTRNVKNSAGRMGGNPYDPLTTTNLSGVDHG
jgi:hypothetical protein